MQPMCLPPLRMEPKRNLHDLLSRKLHKSSGPLWFHKPHYLVPKNGTNNSQRDLILLLLYPLNPLNSNPPLPHTSGLLPPSTVSYPSAYLFLPEKYAHSKTPPSVIKPLNVSLIFRQLATSSCLHSEHGGGQAPYFPTIERWAPKVVEQEHIWQLSWPHLLDYITQGTTQV